MARSGLRSLQWSLAVATALRKRLEDGAPPEAGNDGS
jgi:hypothetical protein